MRLRSSDGEGRRLPSDHGSLAFGVAPRNPGAARTPAPGAISALAIGGGYTVGPRENRTVLFGRNKDEVHVCVGEDDRRVSRQQGVLTHRRGQWWVGNTGRLPIRLPQSRWLFPEEEEVPLTSGYTPMFLRGSADREHLLEVYVVGSNGEQPTAVHTEPTDTPRTWRLEPHERLVLVALGQRYLRHEARPQPLSRVQVADLLAELQPDAEWGYRKVERVVANVRYRLAHARQPVAGLTKEEVPEPVGNWLNHNLLTELVMNTTTLVPPDLALLDEPPAPESAD
ncbi:FHA domain-containing protein [Amycolatopsis sp. NPDC059021]|uniref:FHA domain-containing protein n=1 Tax=Amycolatopsis sp. NPDC059021 TaxID=3346704 RepID=UPI00366DCF19